MQFGLLGPFEVRHAGEVIAVGGPKQQSVLALLLLDANRVVTTDQLIDGVWDDEPPDRAVATIQVYISNLRKALAPTPGVETSIEWTGHGYRMRVAPELVDVHQFEHLAMLGRTSLRAGDAVAAVAALERAVALVRGLPGTGLVGERIRTASARLQELYLTTLEDCNEARLRLGQEREIVGALSTLVQQHPYRERLRALLMIALFQSGRQAEALASYRDARTLLLDRLGIDPGPELRDLELAILNQDRDLWAVLGSSPAGSLADRSRGGASVHSTSANTLRQAASGDVSAVLVLPDGTHQILGGQATTIGRGSSCTVTLLDPNVSRRHAVIRHIGDGFVLSDLGSTNGCRVNGEAIADHTLVADDVIEIAGCHLRFLGNTSRMTSGRPST